MIEEENKYKALLKKYMAHVVNCEGIDYLSVHSKDITETDLLDLKIIQAEVHRESANKMSEFMRYDKIINRVQELKEVHELKRGRKKEVVAKRQAIMYWLSKNTDFSLAKIGELLTYSGRLYDHATVLHAKKTIQNRLDTNDELVYIYESMWKELNQYKRR